MERKDELRFTYRGKAKSEKWQSARFHFSLCLLSLAKEAHWLTKALAERGSFSLQAIETSSFNQPMLHLFIEGFGMGPIKSKNNPNDQKLADYAKIAA